MVEDGTTTTFPSLNGKIKIEKIYNEILRESKNTQVFL